MRAHSLRLCENNQRKTNRDSLMVNKIIKAEMMHSMCRMPKVKYPRARFMFA